MMNRLIAWLKTRSGRIREHLQVAKLRCPSLSTGYLHLLRGEYAEARKWLQQATEMRPDAALPFVLLGTAHIRLGEYSAARSAFEAAIRLDPTSPYAHGGLVIALARLDKRDQAVVVARKVLSLGPTDMAILRAAGMAFQSYGLKLYGAGVEAARAGQYASALSLSEQALPLFEEAVGVLDQVLRRGIDDEAKEVHAEVVRLCDKLRSQEFRDQLAHLADAAIPSRTYGPLHLSSFASEQLFVEECLSCGSVYVSTLGAGKPKIGTKFETVLGKTQLRRVEINSDERLRIIDGRYDAASCPEHVLAPLSDQSAVVSEEWLAERVIQALLHHNGQVNIFARVLNSVRQCLGQETLVNTTVSLIERYYAERLTAVDAYLKSRGERDVDAGKIHINHEVGSAIILTDCSRQYIPFLCRLIASDTYVKWRQAEQLLTAWPPLDEADRADLLKACRCLLELKHKHGDPALSWVSRIENLIARLEGSPA